LAVADITNDGRLDLIVSNAGTGAANFADGTVSVLLGIGDGSFQAAQLQRPRSEHVHRRG
jgi:hypothetical protein